MSPIFCTLFILLVLYITYTLFKKINYAPRLPRFFGQEGFAYQPMKTSNSLAPYQCVQNSYRPEVITSYGTYATQECQTTCKD